MQLVLHSFDAGSTGRSYRRGWNLGTSAVNPRLGTRQNWCRGAVASEFHDVSDLRTPRYANESGWIFDSEPNTLFGPLILGKKLQRWSLSASWSFSQCPRPFCYPMRSRYLFPSTVKSSSQSHSSIFECIWVSYISCPEPLLGPHVSVWRKHRDRGDPSQRYDLALRNALLLPVEVPFCIQFMVLLGECL